jgi:hypothetical protein
MAQLLWENNWRAGAPGVGSQFGVGEIAANGLGRRIASAATAAARRRTSGSDDAVCADGDRARGDDAIAEVHDDFVVGRHRRPAGK